MTNGAIVAHGAIGGGASFVAWLIARASEINPLLQSASLTLGIIIGIVTLVKLARKNKPKT